MIQCAARSLWLCGGHNACFSIVAESRGKCKHKERGGGPIVFKAGNFTKKGLTTCGLLRIIIKHSIEGDAELCNGSTCDSDSYCEGSNPSSATTTAALAAVFFRGIAQMVARLVRDQEAWSSNLHTPTISLRTVYVRSDFFYLKCKKTDFFRLAVH